MGVHFSFVLIAFIVGGGGNLTDLGAATEITAVLAAIFVAVLLHEAGHALVARRFGAKNISIALFALGGVTTYSNDPPLSPGKRFVITAAGSAAGIVVGGSLALLWWAGLFDSASTLARLIGGMFIFASLGWGVLNWIPIRPLDGGQMLTAALEIFVPRRAESIARVVTVVVGIVLIGVALRFDEPFMAIFVAVLVFLGLRGPGAPEQKKAVTERSAGFEPKGSLSDETLNEPPPEFPI